MNKSLYYFILVSIILIISILSYIFYLPKSENNVSHSSQYINVIDFGAVGDGVQDDTKAIQAAISRANGRNKESIFIPAGYYLLSSPLLVPDGVSLLGSNRGFSSGKYDYLCGTVLLKNHNGNCISIIGNGNSSVGGAIQDIAILGSNSNTSGSAIFIDGVHQEIIRNVMASRIGGDSFVFGKSNLPNFTTYVTAYNVYANSVPIGKCAFNCNGRWFRLYDCICDGSPLVGMNCFCLTDSYVLNFHAENILENGILLNSSPYNTFERAYLALGSKSFSNGISMTNTNGNFFNTFNSCQILSAKAYNGQRGISVLGSSCTFNRFYNVTISGLDLGFSNYGLNTTFQNCLLYNNHLPIDIGSDGSYIENIVTQATAGMYSIRHSSGSVGMWLNNTLDKPILPFASKDGGNFLGIRLSNNIGYITKASGNIVVTGQKTQIVHGLASTPSLIFLSQNGADINCQLSWSNPNPSQFTINYSGTSQIQVSWLAFCQCNQ